MRGRRRQFRGWLYRQGGFRRAASPIGGRRVRRGGGWRLRVLVFAGCRTAFPVEKLLLPPSLVRLIVLLTPCVGQFATLVLTASELTVKILPTGIPRMRQEADSATVATDRTACQIRMLAQNGIQRQLILTNKRKDAVLPMPFWRNRKEFPDGYDKNARFSVRIASVVSMSPSYLLDAQASRSRAGIFLGISTDARRAGRITASSASGFPGSPI